MQFHKNEWWHFWSRDRVTICDYRAALHKVWKVLEKCVWTSATNGCLQILHYFHHCWCFGKQTIVFCREEIHFWLYGKLSYFKPEQQCSEANTVVPGTLTSPIIRHVTAGLLSVTACTFHFPLCTVEEECGDSSKKEKKNTNKEIIFALHLSFL